MLYGERPVGSKAPDKDPPGNITNWSSRLLSFRSKVLDKIAK